MGKNGVCTPEKNQQKLLKSGNSWNHPANFTPDQKREIDKFPQKGTPPLLFWARRAKNPLQRALMRGLTAFNACDTMAAGGMTWMTLEKCGMKAPCCAIF